MKRVLSSCATLLSLIFVISGCGMVGNKSAGYTISYISTMLLSLGILIGYCLLIGKKDKWFLLLFSSIFTVNTGYLLLAVSSTINSALWANRLSYLGSVVLPLSMLMIILEATDLKYKKWLPVILFALSAAIFFITASPGYLDIYYKQVSIATINGVTVLQKVYGPWHSIYLFYLMGYFATMIVAIAYSHSIKRTNSLAHSLVMLTAVFVNIAVWLLEQVSSINFEFLSVSYIISELFLLGLHMVQLENERLLTEAVSAVPVAVKVVPAAEIIEQPEAAVPAIEEAVKLPRKPDAAINKHIYFKASLPQLTPTERVIYDFYVAGASTKEIMQALDIKENTLKYHNKNMYGKLGVKSRKELMQLAKEIAIYANPDTLETEK